MKIFILFIFFCFAISYRERWSVFIFGRGVEGCECGQHLSWRGKGKGGGDDFEEWRVDVRNRWREKRIWIGMHKSGIYNIRRLNRRNYFKIFFYQNLTRSPPWHNCFVTVSQHCIETAARQFLENRVTLKKKVSPPFRWSYETVEIWMTLLVFNLCTGAARQKVNKYKFTRHFLSPAKIIQNA